MRNAPPFLRVSCEKELIFDSGGIQKPVKDIIQNIVHGNNLFKPIVFRVLTLTTIH